MEDPIGAASDGTAPPPFSGLIRDWLDEGDRLDEKAAATAAAIVPAAEGRLRRTVARLRPAFNRYRLFVLAGVGLIPFALFTATHPRRGGTRGADGGRGDRFARAAHAHARSCARETRIGHRHPRARRAGGPSGGRDANGGRRQAQPSREASSGEASPAPPPRRAPRASHPEGLTTRPIGLETGACQDNRGCRWQASGGRMARASWRAPPAAPLRPRLPGAPPARALRPAQSAARPGWPPFAAPAC